MPLYIIWPTKFDCADVPCTLHLEGTVSTMSLITCVSVFVEVGIGTYRPLAITAILLSFIGQYVHIGTNLVKTIDITKDGRCIAASSQCRSSLSPNAMLCYAKLPLNRDKRKGNATKMSNSLCPSAEIKPISSFLPQRVPPSLRKF